MRWTSESQQLSKLPTSIKTALVHEIETIRLSLSGQELGQVRYLRPRLQNHWLTGLANLGLFPLVILSIKMPDEISTKQKADIGSIPIQNPQLHLFRASNSLTGQTTLSSF